jgi:hypothetical protein
VIFNPRRDKWDGDLKQDISNADFKEQVDWEMELLIKADVITLYLQPGTISPISLLELGLHANTGKMVVCCPSGYHRRGNVQIVCHRHGIPLMETKDEFEKLLREKLEEVIKMHNA